MENAWFDRRARRVESRRDASTPSMQKISSRERTVRIRSSRVVRSVEKGPRCLEVISSVLSRSVQMSVEGVALTGMEVGGWERGFTRK